MMMARHEIVALLRNYIDILCTNDNDKYNDNVRTEYAT